MNYRKSFFLVASFFLLVQNYCHAMDFIKTGLQHVKEYWDDSNWWVRSAFIGVASYVIWTNWAIKGLRKELKETSKELKKTKKKAVAIEGVVVITTAALFDRSLIEVKKDIEALCPDKKRYLFTDSCEVLLTYPIITDLKEHFRNTYNIYFDDKISSEILENYCINTRCQVNMLNETFFGDRDNHELIPLADRRQLVVENLKLLAQHPSEETPTNLSQSWVKVDSADGEKN